MAALSKRILGQGFGPGLNSGDIISVAGAVIGGQKYDWGQSEGECKVEVPNWVENSTLIGAKLALSKRARVYSESGWERGMCVRTLGACWVFDGYSMDRFNNNKWLQLCNTRTR